MEDHNKLVGQYEVNPCCLVPTFGWFQETARSFHGEEEDFLLAANKTVLKWEGCELHLLEMALWILKIFRSQKNTQWTKGLIDLNGLHRYLYIYVFIYFSVYTFPETGACMYYIYIYMFPDVNSTSKEIDLRFLPFAQVIDVFLYIFFYLLFYDRQPKLTQSTKANLLWKEERKLNQRKLSRKIPPLKNNNRSKGPNKN